MRDADCVAFLQWALPRLDLSWPGFRKVRAQVCKRIKRRMKDLGIASFNAYRDRLGTDPQEWLVLDGYCYITISRFYRDRGIFDVLRAEMLPAIAARAKEEGRAARCWSAGCACGEEPYTLKILWDLDVAPRFEGVVLEVVATDIDAVVLERARRGCYARGSLRELPAEFIAQAFETSDDQLCVGAHHREGITFLRQDLRVEAPAGPFDMVLCRNTAFTYFAPPLQENALKRIVERLLKSGWLVIGGHESLPEQLPGLGLQPHRHGIFELPRSAIPRRSSVSRRPA
jgi:chemotaxis protein methyltransferase CheR